jgi:hypothetical protein
MKQLSGFCWFYSSLSYVLVVWVSIWFKIGPTGLVHSFEWFYALYWLSRF